jgi:hypothetical protein
VTAAGRQVESRDGRASRRPISLGQRLTAIYGVLTMTVVLVVLQLWLLTATMNAYLGHDESVIWPAAVASLGCLLLNAGLLLYVYRIDRSRS